jgi:tetratricopeptide (TPR) repeat protein
LDRFTERAHLAGDLCLLGMIWLLKNVETNIQKTAECFKIAAAIFCLQILWANLHGSFILGPILLVIYILADTISIFLRHAENNKNLLKNIRNLFYLLGSSLVGCCITPYGWKSLLAPIQHFGLSHQSRLLLAEWQPTHWSGTAWQLQLLIVIVGLSILLALAYLWIGRNYHTLIKPLLLTIAFGYLATHSYRFILSAAVVILPLIPDWYDNLHFKLKGPQRTGALGILVSGILFIAAASKTPITNNFRNLSLQTVPLGMPVATSHYLQQHGLKGNLFHSFDYGSYLAAELYPNFKIFIDGRLDLYNQNLSRDYMNFLESEKLWLESPWHKQITAIVLNYKDPLSQGFLDRLLTSHDWAMVFIEEDAALLLRRDIKEYQQLIETDQFVYLRPTNRLNYLQPLASDAKKIAAALKEVDRLKAMQPDFILPWLIDGHLHAIHPDPVQRALACGFFEEARQRLPSEVNIQFLLAVCYGEQHDLTRAMNLFRKLTTVAAMREKALLNLGLCHAKLGTFDEARSTWETLLGEFPHNSEAKKMLLLLPNK